MGSRHEEGHRGARHRTRLALPVGAGAGSVARWLADVVGPGGEVVATDVSTIHLDGFERPNLEVREHDILVDPLPEGRFDLIHARLLVEHLGTDALAGFMSRSGYDPYFGRKLVHELERVGLADVAAEGRLGV